MTQNTSKDLNGSGPKITRRDFLKRTGLSIAGVAVAGSALTALTGCEEAYATTYPEKVELAYNDLEKTSDAPAPYPYPYQKLDPATCAERAYAGYQQKGG